jgi:ubiquinone/menaquinone biosynthesis C-methylase UbiE
MEPIREAVRQKYAQTAIQLKAGAGCCGSDCCGNGACSDPVTQAKYSERELAELGLNAGLSLGCGNPTALAELRAGETVLDLGSGAGLDVLLSARRVTPGGHAYGVEMTDEMLKLAGENQKKTEIANATFLKGTIEEVPLPNSSVDVIISNWVINLAADKHAVIAEAHRLLKPGGRLAIADMVEVETLAPAVKSALDAWTGCVAGTIPVQEYREALVSAGFEEIDIEITRTFTPADLGLAEVAGKTGSAFIRARKS